MENLGTEVGHKMRSAVKAKLIELGTGGSAGYIDDELPDYVMIMVANKRSKQQMTEDLNLFLGSNTEVFVSWLHQVLQKLQEVTLPATNALKTKRKSSESVEKKDKKDKKKKLKRSHKIKEVIPTTSHVPLQVAITAPLQQPPSITDVFADHLIQKARSTLTLENSASIKTKNEQTNSAINNSVLNTKSVDEFDIPTISEIAENAAGNINRRKELSELADLQKKINQAKRQLKALGSEESEDEDFINIKDDGEELPEVDDTIPKPSKIPVTAPKSSSPTQINTESQKEVATKPQRVHITFREEQKKCITEEPPAKKRPILDRLGIRPSRINAGSSTRRNEKEIYVPVFRRKDDDKKSERERDRNKVKSRETTKDLRDRVKEKDKKERNNFKTESTNITTKVRVGSRVIVAPPKPEYDEDAVEVPVNSVVKVQPRPIVPTNKQASKNLLLRAVAEAQKSTALVKPRHESRTTAHDSTRPQKLYSKSYRDNKSGLSKGKSNIVVEVSTEKQPEEDEKEMEYITQIVLDEDVESENDGYVYIPLNMSSGNSDEEMKSPIHDSDSEKKLTQFVVTLDDKEKDNNINKSMVNEKNGLDIIQPKKYLESVSKEKISSPLRVEVATQKVNKLIIKNDTEDEEELRKEVERSTTPRRHKRIHVSPIKFDIKTDVPTKRSKSRENDDVDFYREKTDDSHKVHTRRTEASRKYENLPPLSSAISNSSEQVAPKSKSKEKCKYYPTCGKGDSCEFSHPMSACKTFPNCKFGEQCLYFHPKCKFDLTCARLSCNFSHTPILSAAPPLSSHVVPVSNYKSIIATPLPAMCKFYPKCTNTMCTFFHPKPCRFGKNCINKVECNFYHFDLPAKDKLKWVASSVY